jgi:ribonuclease D
MWTWRESVAQREDRALFRIISTEALVAVARALPGDVGALARVRELPPALAQRHGPALVAAVERATRLEESALPQIERSRRAPRDLEVEGRLDRLRAARNAVAQDLAIEPGVLIGRAALEALARARPTDRAGLVGIAELRRWQIEVLGDALLAALA